MQACPVIQSAWHPPHFRFPLQFPRQLFHPPLRSGQPSWLFLFPFLVLGGVSQSSVRNWRRHCVSVRRRRIPEFRPRQIAPAAVACVHCSSMRLRQSKLQCYPDKRTFMAKRSQTTLVLLTLTQCIYYWEFFLSPFVSLIIRFIEASR